jgi:hypothetical protein
VDEGWATRELKEEREEVQGRQREEENIKEYDEAASRFHARGRIVPIGEAPRRPIEKTKAEEPWTEEGDGIAFDTRDITHGSSTELHLIIGLDDMPRLQCVVHIHR